MTNNMEKDVKKDTKPGDPVVSAPESDREGATSGSNKEKRQ
jgi:hypothetical protein